MFQGVGEVDIERDQVFEADDGVNVPALPVLGAAATAKQQLRVSSSNIVPQPSAQFIMVWAGRLLVRPGFRKPAPPAP